MAETKRKTALFTSVNATGHINPLLGLADRLKRDYNFNTIFLLFGPPCTNAIEARGHRLVSLEDTVFYEDYEVSEEEIETGVRFDEAERERRGLKKKKFVGVEKFEHLIKISCRPSQQPTLANRQLSELSFKLWLEESIANNATYERMIKELEADLVVIDAIVSIPAIVNLKHIPWVRCDSVAALYLVGAKKDLAHAKPQPNFGFSLLTKAERERVRREEPERWQAMLAKWAEAAEARGKAAQTSSVLGPLMKFFMENGLAPPDADSMLPMHDSPHLNLYMYPKELDYDQDDDLFEYKPRRFRCDSLISISERHTNSDEVARWDAKLEQAAARLTGNVGSLESQGIDLVYVSMGTVASAYLNVMRRLVEMLAQDTKKRLYVMSKGKNGDQLQLVAPNMIGANYLPQTLLLERAQLAMVHGGNNSLAECCHFGVPMIVMPSHGDQFDNAQRVEDLKLGRRLDPSTCSASELLQAIDELLADAELRRKMSRISANMRARDDASKAAALLNKLANEGKLEQTFIDACREKNFHELNF